MNTADGGKVSITSDAAITIARGATIDVSAARGAAGKAGSAIVFAGTNLDVASGAVFRGVAGTSGDGGFLELSARQTVTLGAVDVDLSARNGKAGLLYIDPTDIVIGTGGSANIVTNGTNVLLEATNSITILGDGIIDTRNFNRSANGGVLAAANPSLGNSGSITLEARQINVAGQLLAGVSPGSAYAAGDITLSASASDRRNSGKATAEATIDVSGTITGRDVKLLADATGVSSFINPGPGIALFAGLTNLSILTGLNGGYVASDITARVSVKNGASITATRDIVISATGTQEATLPAVSVTAVSPLAAAVTYADLKARVTAEIESGASLTIGRNLTVEAKNEATLGATALAASAGQTLAAFAVAVGTTDIETKAIVSSGATVTVSSSASNVRVSAINQNAFSTSATAMSISGGMVGLSVAYSDTKASAEARLGASLGSSSGRIGNVTVEAISDNSKNATSSAVTLGQNLIIESLQIANAMETLFAPLTSRLGSREIGKFGSTLTLAKSDLAAIASIAADSGGTAPTIYATKAAVVSDVRDFALRAAADAGLSSNSKDPTAVNPEATVAMSAAVVYGDFRHTSRASIGAGVTVDANRIGVSATTAVPIANTWTDWGGFGETLSHLNGTFGVAGNILTSYASATAESSQLGLAGAVDYYKIANQTEAYVGPGATLRQNGALGSWDIALGTGALQSFDKAVTVAASTTTETIDVAGNYGIFSGTGTSGGAGSAVGGAFADLQRESRTVAAVGAGVTITALELAVTAKTEDKIFVLAPTSGKAAGAFAANGMVVLVGIDNHTLASISNQATIDVTSIDVTARQFVSLFALTGAVTYGGANAIGVSVAALDTAGVTRAHIGDNSADLSGNRLGSGYAQGLITTRLLDVEAVTDGRITVASIAAAISDPNASKLSFFKGIAAQGKTDAAVLRSGAGSGISLTAAGSAAVATTTLGTSAWIDGAVVVAKAGGAVITDVAATNAMVAEVASGSAALNLTGASSPLSGALSGAVAIGLFDNSTDARIAGTTITGAGDTIVQALAGGRQTVVGVSIAAARANSGAAAVSAAIGIITDSVSAQIRNSAINGISGASSGNDVLVNAYRATDIGIGGGAAYAGAQAGLGVALTYVSIADPSGRDTVAALITDTSLSAVDKLTVAARTSSRIVSSAIAGGGGPDLNGLAGAIVITEISPTTRAAVTDTAGSPSRIAMDGDVLVVADSGKDSTLDAALDSRLANTDPGQIDFTGSATNANQAANPVGASILAIAGAVQAGKNNIGSSFLSNTISQSHVALIENVDLTSPTDVTVRAQDGSLITAVAVGLGVATGQFAGVASVAQQTIDAVVTARISGGSIMSRDVAVQAQASSTIRGSAGSLGIGIGAAAVGLSIVESSIANDVAAEIEGTQIRATRDVVLTAGSTATIDTIAIGVAMSRNVGLAGSVANNSVATDVGATITGADIIAGNNLGVFAANTDRITVSAGALGATVAAPSVAGGVSVVNNTIGGTTAAAIEGSSVDARAGGTGSLSYDAGQLLTAFDLSTANGPSAAQPSLAMTARSVHGLGVIATSQQSVLANAVTGGVAGFPISGAVAIVPIRNVLGGSTSATIDSSQVDTRLTGTDSTAVAVEAASHSYAATFITVGAIGGVAASGANASNLMERSTKAALTRSTTGTTTPGYTGPGVGALDIAATSSQSAASNVIGFALGLGGAAAMGVVNSFGALTSASLDQGLVTAGRVGVTADSRNGFYARTVAAVAGGVGVGSAFIVGTSRNATLATIGGGSGQTVLNLNGALAVAATSRNAFTTLASGGAAGGFAGVAGMVSFVDVDNQTRAGLYGARVTIQPGATQTVGGVISAAGISVTAHEATSITPTTAAGATGSIGAGAGANIASLDGLVQADIQGSTLVAPGTVSASATSERDVSALTVTYGVGGSAGIGAAVALISVGTGMPSGASGELTAGGSGTLSRIGQLTAGNADLVLSAAGLASYRSYRGAAGTAMSEGELREAARTDYNLLLANGTVSGGAYTLTDAGVTALRSNAATALGIANPSDAQVRSWAATRYAAFSGGAVSYLLSDTGLSTYRSQVVATTPGASDDQIRSAANDAYARLLANGTVSGGVLTLSTAGLETYRAAANASLGRPATDTEIRNYAAQQYGFFTGNRSRIAAPAAQSAAALLESAGSATTASVSGGSIVSGAVAVSALSRTTTTNTADGVGVGGGGVGAATAYTDIGDKVSARLDQISVTTGSIAVTANSTDGTGSAARVEATAGAGGLAAAAGAAVADGAISNQVTATLGGTLTVTGATSVNARNSQTSRSDAFGATVAGGLALGVSLAKSSAESTVAARYANGSRPHRNRPYHRRAKHRCGLCRGRRRRRRPARGRLGRGGECDRQFQRLRGDRRRRQDECRNRHDQRHGDGIARCKGGGLRRRGRRRPCGRRRRRQRHCRHAGARCDRGQCQPDREPVHRRPPLGRSDRFGVRHGCRRRRQDGGFDLRLRARRLLRRCLGGCRLGLLLCQRHRHRCAGAQHQLGDGFGRRLCPPAVRHGDHHRDEHHAPGGQGDWHHRRRDGGHRRRQRPGRCRNDDDGLAWRLVHHGRERHRQVHPDRGRRGYADRAYGGRHRRRPLCGLGRDRLDLQHLGCDRLHRRQYGDPDRARDDRRQPRHALCRDSRQLAGHGAGRQRRARTQQRQCRCAGLAGRRRPDHRCGARHGRLLSVELPAGDLSDQPQCVHPARSRRFRTRGRRWRHQRSRRDLENGDRRHVERHARQRRHPDRWDQSDGGARADPGAGLDGVDGERHRDADHRRPSAGGGSVGALPRRCRQHGDAWRQRRPELLRRHQYRHLYDRRCQGERLCQHLRPRQRRARRCRRHHPHRQQGADRHELRTARPLRRQRDRRSRWLRAADEQALGHRDRARLCPWPHRRSRRRRIDQPAEPCPRRGRQRHHDLQCPERHARRL